LPDNDEIKAVPVAMRRKQADLAWILIRFEWNHGTVFTGECQSDVGFPSTVESYFSGSKNMLQIFSKAPKSIPALVQRRPVAFVPLNHCQSVANDFQSVIFEPDARLLGSGESVVDPLIRFPTIDRSRGTDNSVLRNGAATEIYCGADQSYQNCPASLHKLFPHLDYETHPIGMINKNDDVDKRINIAIYVRQRSC